MTDYSAAGDDYIEGEGGSDLIFGARVATRTAGLLEINMTSPDLSKAGWSSRRTCLW